MQAGVADREVTRNLKERSQEAAQHQAEAQRGEAARAALASELEAAHAATTAAGVLFIDCLMSVAACPLGSAMSKCGARGVAQRLEGFPQELRCGGCRTHAWTLSHRSSSVEGVTG